MSSEKHIGFSYENIFPHKKQKSVTVLEYYRRVWERIRVISSHTNQKFTNKIGADTIGTAELW